MAQFAHTNSHCKSIGTTPNYLLMGYHPRTPLTLGVVSPTDVDDPHLTKKERARALVREMEKDMTDAKKSLQQAADGMKVQYDKKHQPLVLRNKQLVLLSTKNLWIPGCSKYLPRFVGRSLYKKRWVHMQCVYCCLKVGTCMMSSMLICYDLMYQGLAVRLFLLPLPVLEDMLLNPFNLMTS
jgi:hypothetical protein